jgi:hypothetical protein
LSRDETGILRGVQEAKIRFDAFDLSGQGNERYVLSGSDNDWSVYYSERGFETNKRHFSSESAALKALLAVFKNDPSTRL